MAPVGLQQGSVRARRLSSRVIVVRGEIGLLDPAALRHVLSSQPLQLVLTRHRAFLVNRRLPPPIHQDGVSPRCALVPRRQIVLRLRQHRLPRFRRPRPCQQPLPERGERKRILVPLLLAHFRTGRERDVHPVRMQRVVQLHQPQVPEVKPGRILLRVRRRQALVIEQELPGPVEIESLRRRKSKCIRSVQLLNRLGDLVVICECDAPHTPSSGRQHHHCLPGVGPVLAEGSPDPAGAKAAEPEGRLPAFIRQHNRTIQAIHDTSGGVKDLKRDDLDPVALDPNRDPVDPFHAFDLLPVPYDAVHFDLHPAGPGIPTQRNRIKGFRLIEDFIPVVPVRRVSLHIGRQIVLQGQPLKRRVPQPSGVRQKARPIVVMTARPVHLHPENQKVRQPAQGPVIEQVRPSVSDQRLHKPPPVAQADPQPAPSLHPLAVSPIGRRQQVIPREHQPHIQPVPRLFDLVEQSQPRQTLKRNAPPPVVIRERPASRRRVLRQPVRILFAQLPPLLAQSRKQTFTFRPGESIGNPIVDNHRSRQDHRCLHIPGIGRRTPVLPARVRQRPRLGALRENLLLRQQVGERVQRAVVLHRVRVGQKVIGRLQKRFVVTAIG